MPSVTCLLAYSENLWLQRERQSFSGQLSYSFLHISQNLISDISKGMVSHSCRCTASCSNCSVFIFFIWSMIFSFILSRLVIIYSYVSIYFYFVISKIFIYCFIQNRKVQQVVFTDFICIFKEKLFFSCIPCLFIFYNAPVSLL